MKSAVGGLRPIRFWFWFWSFAVFIEQTRVSGVSNWGKEREVGINLNFLKKLKNFGAKLDNNRRPIDYRTPKHKIIYN